MNIAQTTQDFLLTWTQFNNNLITLSERKFKLSESNPYLPFGDLLHKVIKEIVSERGMRYMKKAVRFKIRGNIQHINYLSSEMEIFNNIVQNNRNANLKVEDIDKGLETGKTIKDSIEGLFKIPVWLKKTLDILNELLSIIRGA